MNRLNYAPKLLPGTTCGGNTGPQVQGLQERSGGETQNGVKRNLPCKKKKSEKVTRLTHSSVLCVKVVFLLADVTSFLPPEWQHWKTVRRSKTLKIPLFLKEYTYRE